MDEESSNTSPEANEPAFLRRLRGENGGSDLVRHGRALERPRKQIQNGADEDQPIYVVENGQDILSKAEYEALMTQAKVEEQSKVSANSPLKEDHDTTANTSGFDEKSLPTDKVPLVRQEIDAIGTSNKRRLAKVIADNDSDEEKLKRQTEGSHKQRKQPDIPKTKKAKKVKLSFEEDAGGT